MGDIFVAVVLGILAALILFALITYSALHYWRALPESRKKKFLPTEHVAILPNCVVTYRPASWYGTNFRTIDQALADIIAANPDTDLTKLESALGIRIVSHQKPGSPMPKPESKGIHISFDQ